MTTREEREYNKAVIKTLEEVIEISIKDADKTDDINEVNYYNGLEDGYRFALELVRGLKT